MLQLVLFRPSVEVPLHAARVRLIALVSEEGVEVEIRAGFEASAFQGDSPTAGGSTKPIGDCHELI